MRRMTADESRLLRRLQAEVRVSGVALTKAEQETVSGLFEAAWATWTSGSDGSGWQITDAGETALAAGGGT